MPIVKRMVEETVCLCDICGRVANDKEYERPLMVDGEEVNFSGTVKKSYICLDCYYDAVVCCYFCEKFVSPDLAKTIYPRGRLFACLECAKRLPEG